MTDNKYLFQIRISTFITICIVILSIFLKLSVYFKFGHQSVLASTLDSISDFCASLIAFIAIRYSYKPVDHDHRFGHYKFEAISSLIISFIILISSFFIIYHSVEALLNNQFHPSGSAEVYWVIAFSGIASLIIYVYQSYLFTKTNNLVIKSDAIHYKADFLLNMMVLVSVYFSKQFPALDSISAIGIALYILYSLKYTFFEAIDQLMDKEIAESDKDKIKSLVEQQGYNLSNLKTRKSGPKIFVQFQILLSCDLKLSECNIIIEKIKQQINTKFADMEIELLIWPAARGDKLD